ncbi:MAG: hypothetical protein P1V35_01515 [Planctomycetota bacterium]|nr:hypothetical protein [Planctomycetota bacterium]
MKLPLLLACAVLLPGCLSGSYNRVDRGAERADTLFADLRVGEASMQQCVEVLGAPLTVRESGSGADLIWGWERNAGFNVTTSIPLGHSASANVAYSKVSRGARGWTLRFDQDWTLQSKREGRLQELLEMSSQPSSLPEGSRTP